MAESAPDTLDPLHAALAEAEHLMEELGTTDDVDQVISGFSIDSDDEDDAPLNVNGAAATTTKDEANKSGEDFHPLHDNFLSAAPAPATAPAVLGTPPHNNNNSNGGMYPQQQQPQMQQQQTTPSMLNGQILQQLPSMSSTGSGVPSGASTPTGGAPGAGASLDVFKAQTSRFASNFANMAQRGFAQVASATTTASGTMMQSSQGMMMANPLPSVSGGPPASPMTPGSAAMMQQPPLQQQPQYMQPPQQQQQPMPPPQQSPLAQQQPQPQPHVDLDNEQKAALVKTHVGELLPGERVIMFMSNLLHVSDSAGFNYSHTTEPNILWCCAMTYYRLILFGTHPSSPEVARPADWNAACWPAGRDHQDVSNTSGGGGSGGAILQMPLASMDRVEKSVFSAGGTTTLMGLLIHGKDNGRQLRFTTPSYADTLRAHEALQTYAFPGRRNLGYLFAFESKREAVMASIVTEEGTNKKTVTLQPTRKRFDAVAEFQRQMSKGGGDVNQQQPNPNGNNGATRPWAIWTNTNQSYQTCMSYPSVICGPACLDESMPDAQRIIRQCASFRSEHRLPAMTWTTGVDGGSLWRCAQPKVGLQGNRSSSDELYLKHIMESAAAATSMSQHARPQLSRSILVQLTGTTDLQNWMPEATCGLKILDLRPRSAAMGNRTGGYGYENTSNYPGSTLQFCNIGNIHAVRDSYHKISALCSSTTTSDLQWNAAVEDTKWLSHIRLILAASWETAYWIHVHKLPVLIHCSHGWDRTGQVGVLSQLLLDPYYRTREGFACLIEKDFLSFGHPFHTRCAHGEGRGGNGDNSIGNAVGMSMGGMAGGVVSRNSLTGGGGGDAADQGQMSPIFIQFLDCVYQIVQLYPECFEFNTKYLLVISEHIYSCRFGNFLCDTERERELVAGIRQRTHSIWDYLDSRDDVLNPCYSAQRSAGVLLMPLPTLLRNVTLWSDRHCRHGPKATVRWLPADVQRPTTTANGNDQNDLSRDQQSALITTQENWVLIHSSKPGVTGSPTKDKQPSEDGEAEEESFTIS